MRKLILVVAVATAAAPAASAQRARYSREPVKLGVPAAGAARPARRATVAPAPSRPIVRPDDPLAGMGKVVSIRQEQIDLLDGLVADCVADGCDGDELGKLYFMKAELYAQAQRYFRLEGQRLAIAADTAKTAAEKDRLRAESAALAAEAKASLVRAVVAYKALADDDRFVNHPRMPEALFFYGWTLGAGGYRTEMRAVFDRLLKDYPQTRYAAEAHLAFADYHFEHGQLADAEARYRRVLQFPKAPMYFYARYKLGWVQLNLGKHQDALEAFHDVAVATRRDPDRAPLHRAALTDLVRAYAEVGNVHRAGDYFRKVAADRAPAMYELLADLYREHGKAEKAIYAYRELIAEVPASPNVCAWQHHVAEAMLTAGTNARRLDEIERLAKLSTAFTRERARPADEIAECRGLASGMTGDLARQWHQEWAKTKDVATFELSRRAYGIYVTHFKGDAAYAETEYYRAELLWSRADAERADHRLAAKLWEDTAAAFVAVVDTAGLERAVLDDAARAVVLATVNAAERDPRPAPPVIGDAPRSPSAIPRPRAIPERDRKVLAAFTLYAARVKGRPVDEVADMKLNHAALLRRHAHHAAAIPILVELIASYRATPSGEDAVNFLLDSYNQLGREAELVAAARDVATDTAFLADKPELRDRLRDIDLTHARKVAERLEAEGRRTGDPAVLVRCGTAYAELYNRDPEARGADELLYNAAVCFEDGKSVGIAIDMYRRLDDLGAEAREDIRARAVARLGAAYARIAYYPMAAKYLERYYTAYGTVKAARELADPKAALSDAVMYRKGAGEDDQAITDTMLLVDSRVASAAEKAEAFFNLYAIHEQAGDADALVAHLRRYLAAHAGAGGPARLVQAHARIGLALWTASCPGKTIDGACVKLTRIRAIDTRRSRHGARVAQETCGPGTRVEVVARDRRKAAAALAAFEKAIEAYERHAAALRDPASPARYWYALATHHVIEPAYEAYLGRAFPANLDFDARRPAQAKRSRARFDAWLADKDAAGKALAVAYKEVIAIGEPTHAVAAAARIGQVAQDASQALTTAPIPTELRRFPEAVELYCDVLGDKTEALDALTVDAFTACLDQSTRLGFFSDASRLCERELGQLLPGQFPSTTERRRAPTLASTITALEPGSVRLE
jgi:tetratricopeptide (TPR) repeat protein